MKTTWQEKQLANQVSHESQSDQQNDNIPEAVSSNDGRTISRQDIQLVQNLIEGCLQMYMNRDEVVKTLLNRARIHPEFTNLVWDKLEEQNAEFFSGYYISLELKKQIVYFNHLPERQYHLMMKYPVAATGQQPHLDDSMSHGLSGSCHVVNGVPAPSNYQPMRMNSGNDILMESSIPPSSGMSSMSISPTSVGHFPFTASEISGMGVDTCALDTAFQTDVGTSIGHSNDSLIRSLAQIPWNFSLSHLTADLSNLGEEFFVDQIPGPPQSDEEKP